MADAVERVADGLRFLPRLIYSGPFVALSLIGVLAHIWALELLAQGVGMPELSFTEATVVFGVLALGFALPNAPGFFGSIQLALYAGLAVYVEPMKVVREGAAFVFFFYVVFLASIVLLALISLTVSALSSEPSGDSDGDGDGEREPTENHAA